MKSNKKELSEIYEKFQKPLLYYILKNVSQKSTAQDLLHEVFIKAYKNFDKLEDKQNIQAWLYKIASNTIIDYFRKKQPQTTDNTDILHEDEYQEEVISELDCCLESFIKQLPKNQKEVLEAQYFKELSLKEYSQQNDLKLSTVKSQSKRAKEKLKDVFLQCCTFEKNSKNQLVDYRKKSSCSC